ncbi:MAG TPA: phospho-sugar mutase, partial [Bacillota bacterium]|nr:phospho-sugar mutase [Bacillota bacterium]
MEAWEKAFHKWQSFAQLDRTLKQDLEKMNEVEIKEAFYKNLSFGTGGMRGIIGPGTDRMNIYTVRKAAAGLANYLRNVYGKHNPLSVVIAYDSRHMSKQFALECAKVFGVHQIHTYIFPTLQPTPLLSFAVRHLQTKAGIMITASHNPPNYNGLKVYNEDGGQLPLEPSEKVIQAVNEIADELTIPTFTEEELNERGLLHWLDDTVVNNYLQAVNDMSYLTTSEKSQPKDLSIVFTPLHGTATELVKSSLKQLKFTNVHIVKEQAIPD